MTAPSRWRGQDIEALNRSCLLKHRFSDEFAARAVAQRMIHQGSSKSPSMWVYPCPTCRGWHVTSKSSGRRWLVTAADIMPYRPRSQPEAHRTPQFANFWGGA